MGVSESYRLGKKEKWNSLSQVEENGYFKTVQSVHILRRTCVFILTLKQSCLLPQWTSDWLASHWPTVDTLGQNRRLSTFVREPARKKQLHPPQHKNYWVYHLDTLDTLDSRWWELICDWKNEKQNSLSHLRNNGRLSTVQKCPRRREKMLMSEVRRTTKKNLCQCKTPTWASASSHHRRPALPSSHWPTCQASIVARYSLVHRAREMRS